jgi:hypothetical protein
MYFLASIILFQLLPFAVIVVWPLMKAGNDGTLPPYIFYDTLAQLMRSYVTLARFCLGITLLHLLIRFLIFGKPNPISTYVLPIFKRMNSTRLGSFILHWVIPLPIAFLSVRFLFNAFESHLEGRVVGCWNTGFPFTYDAGCSTPPISVPGVAVAESVDFTTSPAYLMNLKFYLAVAFFSITYINVLALSKNRFIKLFSRYSAFLFLVLTVAPPWFKGYNHGHLEIGTPWKFLSHYYSRGVGDVYDFMGKGLSVDILACFGAATLISAIHIFYRPNLSKHA